jgi:serine/threonine protein kinase/membrane-associated phospholipid phosphatase
VSDAYAKLDTPAPGRRLGHYAIQDRLGRGGMGEVLLALDTRLGRKVALKILPAEFVADEERLSRFQREARALAALNHPNIVTIYSVEQVEGFHFLTMELVEGQSLRQLMPRAGMDLAAFLDVAVPLADAVAAAHERGITHRDLKPENLMVTPSARVKVLDFGLAKRSREEGASPAVPGATETLTRDGLVVGTVPYMSPEQAQGKAVDERSDVFSLGVIFYEMLAGRRPFRGDSMAEVISAILRDAPAALGRSRAGVPRAVERIVARCLEKDPAARHKSARELHADLSDVKRELDIEVALSSGRRRMSWAWGSMRSLSLGRLLESRGGLTLLMAGVFAVNLVETSVESWLRRGAGLGSDLGFAFARAAHWLEGGLSFEAHDVSSALALYGNSLAYFFLFPLLLLGMAWALARRAAIAPYRSLALSLVIAYAACLPFYLFCPMPERWAFPESEAVLLSDLWSSRLIEGFRPISGLDNCFPSFHVALSVIVALLGLVHRVRWRLALVGFASLVILSTFVLGIHWLVDIAAGAAVGVLSVALALRWERSLVTPSLTSTQPTLGGAKTV